MRKKRLALMLILAATAGCAAVNPAPQDSQAQEVLGTAVLAIIPVYPDSLPQPPIDLTLRIKVHRKGSYLTFDIADRLGIWELRTVEPRKVGVSLQNFRLMLPPGEYSIAGFGVRARSLSDRIFFLPLGGPTFNVPESRCVYIGRINATYLRLAPGPLEQAQAAAGEASALIGGKPLLMIYLPQGALLWMNAFVDLAAEDSHTQASMYSKQVLAYAREKECAFLLKPATEEQNRPLRDLEVQLGPQEAIGLD